MRTRRGIDRSEIPLSPVRRIYHVDLQILAVWYAPSRSRYADAGTVSCVAAAEQVYRLFGAEGNLVAAYPEGGHGFPPEAREEAYRFLDAILRHEGAGP